MALVVALVAVAIFAFGMVAGIIGVVAVAVRREEQAHSMTGKASDPVTRAGRWLTGLSVRGLAPAAVDEDKTLVNR
ncbi:MAG: hypothetical protein ACM3ML_38015 [Micromonosporaceae bacterium]